MAIKELVHDEAVLSTPCEKATAEDAQVAQDLLDTMASLDEAACCARGARCAVRG